MVRFAKYLVIATLAITTSAFAADTYLPDASHSTIGFKIRHLGISTVPGQFKDYTGKIIYDSASPEKSSVEFTVKAASIDTADAKRDAHVKKDDFLDVVKFPTITFKSTAVKKIDDTTYEIQGDFTLHGVTKTLTVTFEDVALGKGFKGEERAGGSVKFKIKRSDFGMTKMIGPVGDDVTVELLIEAIKS